MTINIKNFLKDKSKLSRMGEFQNLKKIDGLEMASISADLYGDGRDDLALFYFSKGANYATLTTTSTITSEFIPWNNSSHKKIIKGLLVNIKDNMVAKLGAIIPDPFATPQSLISSSPTMISS